MRQGQRVALFVLIGLGLLGCSQSDMIAKFASDEDQALARGYIDQLRQRHLEGIEAAIDPSLASAALGQTLAKMAIQFPVGEPTSVKLVGAHSLRGPEFSTVNLTYEYEFDGNWLLTNVALKKQGGRTTIVGLHVYPESMPLEAQNRFSLSGKGPIQYLVLVLAVLLPLFTLAVLVSCIRAKLTGRKWPWVLFILVGVGKFSVNWTTGQWAVSLTSVQLFCASAFAPLYGPWTIAVSLPLGALVFLLLRRRLSEPKAEA